MSKRLGGIIYCKLSRIALHSVQYLAVNSFISLDVLANKDDMKQQYSIYPLIPNF